MLSAAQIAALEDTVRQPVHRGITAAGFAAVEDAIRPNTSGITAAEFPTVEDNIEP